MLFTKNALQFRRYFKYERSDARKDLNFIGSLFKKDGRNIEGFASLSLGNREDIGKYLSTVALNVAADDQAIYELIQNADDSRSSLFSVSYNEKYLLCINNGACFSYKDMAAIINVAGNFKDGEDIGTFGIGFKILHRLVGSDDGRSAIVNDYAGPIIFSWHKFHQFEDFVNDEPIAVAEDKEVHRESPWLVKILNTCFPSHLDEELRLNDYDTVASQFKEGELQEMRGFLQTALLDAKIKTTNNLGSGSIFFLKLGPGKHKFLTDGIEKIKSGLAYSFKFLNHLKKIYINGEEITEQKVDAHSVTYQVGSEEFLKINPKNKNRDIRFTFAFYRDYKEAESLRNGSIPNLYTFFSMDEEKNGLGFILHCNAFDMNNDRRKLQANSQINENLLPLIARDILEYVERQKSGWLFPKIYASLLLAHEPVNKEHINNYFFSFLKKYLQSNIPTKGGYATSSEQIRIRGTMIDVRPDILGCPDIQWFYWNSEKHDPLLLQAAREPNKLGLKVWGIIDLLHHAIQQGKLYSVDQWVRKLQEDTTKLVNEERRLKANTPGTEIERKPKPYLTLLREIDRQVTRNNFEVISHVKLFKFSDNQFYSINDANIDDDLVLISSRTYEIRFELQTIGFKTSLLNLSEQTNLEQYDRLQGSDLNLFQRIEQKVKTNTLWKDKKHKLFQALSSFEHVGPERLKNIELFKNNIGDVKPLRQMLKGDQQVPVWLTNYKIDLAEYLPVLDPYLLTEKDVYRELILPNWQALIGGKLNITEFYQNVKYYYDLDEKNTPFKDEPFVFVDPRQGFVKADQVFYNKNLSNVPNYSELQEALSKIYLTAIPFRQILLFLQEAPFKLDSKNLLSLAKIEDGFLSLHDIKAILNFCKANQEHFFQHYAILGNGDRYKIMDKSETTMQVRPTSKELKQFIEPHLSTNFIILAFELDEYKDEPGIIQGESLYNAILELTDINLHHEVLVDLLRYDEPKRNFLLGLREIKLNSSATYEKDSAPTKLIKLACDNLKESDHKFFREKVLIENNGKMLSLAQIPPFSDNISILGQTLLLSEILKDSHKNSAYLSDLLSQFIDLGLSKEKLYQLFGIADEPEPEVVYNLLKAKSTLLDNAQQLAFILLCSQLEFGDEKEFEVNTLDGNYSLSYSYYTEDHMFISRDAILDPKYAQVSNYIKLPFSFGEATQISMAPYLEGNSLIAPYICQTLDDLQKIALIDFLFLRFQFDQVNFALVNWTKIGDENFSSLLGFDPNRSVFPNELALPEEQLPVYVQAWMDGSINKVEFLAALGVWTEGSTLARLRRCFAGEEELPVSSIAKEVLFTDDQMLFQTLKMFSLHSWQLDMVDGLPLITEVIRVINTFRPNNRKIQINYTYDVDLLRSAKEWEVPYYQQWKQTNDESFEIFLYNGLLPQNVTIDGIKDFVFSRLNRGNVMIDTENRIYVNQNTDIKTALSSLIAEENDFDAESLLQLYQVKDAGTDQSDDVQELRDEIGRLRQRIAQLENTSGTVTYNATISHDDTYHQEIKEKSERFLYEYLQEEFSDDEVLWLNQDPNDGTFLESWAHHDFEIKNKKEKIIHYIDCKGTPRDKKTFYLTSNEWHFSLECKGNNVPYSIYRVYNVDNKPECLSIVDPHQWIASGRLVPYLSATETIRGDRVFLTVRSLSM